MSLTHSALVMQSCAPVVSAPGHGSLALWHELVAVVNPWFAQQIWSWPQSQADAQPTMALSLFVGPPSMPRQASPPSADLGEHTGGDSQKPTLAIVSGVVPAGHVPVDRSSVSQQSFERRSHDVLPHCCGI